MATNALQGVGVLVTRPQHQAEPLCALLQTQGANPIVFPVLEITDAEDQASLLAIIDQLERFDIAIFISANAVSKAMNLIQGRRELPAALQLAAVGKSSARALERHGHAVDIVPAQRFDSEALLAMPALTDVAGKRIVIFRGDGGRELLADTLQQRGAEVVYAECYRRIKPEADTGDLLSRWARGNITVVVLTSAEGMRNLFDMLGDQGQPWLRKTPMVVMSERMRALALELGVSAEVLVPVEASDQAVVDTLTAWRQQQQ